MLIVVNGITIDTTKIYAIKPIRETNERWIKFYFTVLFWNKKEIEFTLVSDIYSDLGAKPTQYYITEKLQNNPIWIIGDYKETGEYKSIKNRITLAYELLITYWNNGKSPIPQINI